MKAPVAVVSKTEVPHTFQTEVLRLESWSCCTYIGVMSFLFSFGSDLVREHHVHYFKLSDSISDFRIMWWVDWLVGGCGQVGLLDWLAGWLIVSSYSTSMSSSWWLIPVGTAWLITMFLVDPSTYIKSDVSWLQFMCFFIARGIQNPIKSQSKPNQIPHVSWFHSVTSLLVADSSPGWQKIIPELSSGVTWQELKDHMRGAGDVLPESPATEHPQVLGLGAEMHRSVIFSVPLSFRGKVIIVSQTCPALPIRNITKINIS